MEVNFNRIKQLETENMILKSEIQRLKNLLEDAGVDYSVKISAHQGINEVLSKECIVNKNITTEQIDLFITLFHGRTDVYAKRFINKAGNVGYSPACSSFWKEGCPKKYGRKIKCAECPNQNWIKLSRKLLREHLEGHKEDCTDVIGIYPMLADETCNFLVFDFDNHDKTKETNEEEGANPNSFWLDDVNAMRSICQYNDVDVLIERSRSGKGAHVWLFFEEAIPVALARRFGSALLTKGAESVNQRDFKSYDRMLPAQDKMPDGGLGNLVALPLQGQALRKGNSAFIDADWKVISDPWTLMRNVRKLSKQLVEEKTIEWTTEGVLGVLADDMSGEKEEQSENDKDKPWEKRKLLIPKEDVDGTVNITLANQIYIKNHNIRARTLNRLRRLAAFSNPEFYKNQAMGFSTKGVPRIIQCGSDTDDYICLPRGLKDKLISLLDESGITYEVNDKKHVGHAVNVGFAGNLYQEQERAVNRMLKYDYGILGAATGFGKTVIGAYLISQRKVNALVLVHNREIMKNWIDDFEKFLHINEELPEYETKKGKRKRKTLVGKLYAGHDSLGGIVDVAMITSFGRKDNIDERIKDYGLVIVDECHHAGAQTHEDVIKEINAKYVYGLTATPKREDGHEQKIYMQFGPIRYRLAAKERAKMQGFEHFVIPRFTSMVNVTGVEWGINDVYRELITNERRNNLIIEDVVDSVKNGRTPLVLTKFKDHANVLVKMLGNKVDHIFLLQGGRSTRERDEILRKLRNVPSKESLALVAIGKYIGEGFNYPRLDTLILAVPIAWQGNVEQYAGRLHRDYEGKTDVIIYDYVDIHIKVLDRMYHKRLRAYKKIGYDITLKSSCEKQKTNAIFDATTYNDAYATDLSQANSEIVISSPGINSEKIRQFIHMVSKKQAQGVKVIVITIPSEEYPDNRIEPTKKLIDELRGAGIYVKVTSGIHEHFAVIDKEIVWYGSINMLSRTKEDDNLMRVNSKEIADELLKIGFGKT